MGEILQIHNRSPERARIVRAAELVRQGQVIAIPTDTFYGLAANPFDPSAVQQIFAIKNRPESQPLLLLVDSLKMAAALSAAPPPEFYRLAEQFWPGPLTIVVEPFIGATTVGWQISGRKGRDASAGQPSFPY